MWPLILLVYVHLLLFGPTVQADGTIYKAVGSDVTLVPVFSGSPTEINWKVDGHKLVDMELNPLSTVFYRLKDRATINERNGELIVRNLNKGDSGVYRVEALANNVIQDTNINLKVLEYPAKPVITNRTIDVYIIELYCESSTANVKYEWRNKTSVLTTAQSYNVSQTKDNVTLTCVVSNEAFQNNSTVIIPPIPVTGSSRGYIAAAAVVILVILILLCCGIFIFILRYFPDSCLGKLILNWFPWLKRCRCDRKADVKIINEGEPLVTHAGGQIPIVAITDLEKCGSVSLRMVSVGNIQSTELCKVGVLSVSATLVENQKSINSLRLTLDKVENPADYTADTKRRNGSRSIVPVEREQDGIKLAVLDAEDVMEMVLKKGDKALYELSVKGPQLKINNITLEAVENFFTVKNLTPKDSGIYKVALRTTENTVTTNTFNLEGLKDKLTVCLNPPENGLAANEIGSITFHPVQIPNDTAKAEDNDNTEEVSVTWTMDVQPVDTSEDRIQIGPQGDLTIKDVTSQDEGLYTVQSKDQEMKREFHLRL